MVHVKSLLLLSDCRARIGRLLKKKPLVAEGIGIGVDTGLGSDPEEDSDGDRAKAASSWIVTRQLSNALIEALVKATDENLGRYFWRSRFKGGARAARDGAQ
jgi:hypothetical protein